MKVHEIKLEFKYFDAIERKDKTFEIRKRDRYYQRGDLLVMSVIDDAIGTLLYCLVTDVFTGGEHGLEAGYCILSIKYIWTGTSGEVKNRKEAEVSNNHNYKEKG